MGLADWSDADNRRLDEGLSYLGWYADSRLTNEDELCLQEIAEESLALASKDELSPEAIDKLSMVAYEIIRFQIVGIEERTRMATFYADSEHLRPLMRLIDEYTLAFFSGYYTAAFALQLIVLESYLRSIIGWRPGDKDPTFSNLRKSCANFPECEAKGRIIGLLDGLYGRYDPLNPTQFFFNRHGLLHGIRGAYSLDELNCGRMFLLFDIFAYFEPKPAGTSGMIDDEYRLRAAAYQKGGVRRQHSVLFRFTEAQIVP